MADGGFSRGGGAGFFTLLGLLFIGLRLVGAIDWPWWAVLSPLLGGELVWLAALVVVVVAAVRELKERRRWQP